MAWRIEFDPRAEKELSRLGREAAQRMLKLLARLAGLDDPRLAGAALGAPRFGEFRRYRAGDFRLIARIEDEAGLIIVLRVGQRRDIDR